MSFAIFTDTSANIPSPDQVKLDIQVIPLSYNQGGQEKTCTDTETFNYEEYYTSMKRGERVTTSQINPQKYVEYMEPALKMGKDILFIGMSSGISGSYHSAAIAKEQLEETYPMRKICLVDSMGASLGEGLQVMKAAQYRDMGKSLEEICQLLNEEKAAMCQIFTVDDLMFLRKGGRLSNASAIVGTLLNVKPILKGNEAGKIVSFAKVRGRKAVIEQLAKRFDENAVAPEDQTVGISHANCLEDARRLADRLMENRPPKEIKIVQHEPVTGSYLGPGALALYFYGDRDVRTKN